MRTAVFGGTFDPPTVAHVKQIKLLSTTSSISGNFHFDRVRIIVSGDQRPDKTGITPATVRFEMLQIAVQEWLEEETEPCVEIICDDIEVKAATFIPTVQMIDILAKKYVDEEHYFVIGEDQAWQVGTSWISGEWLRLNAMFCVLPRKGFVAPSDRVFDKHHVQRFVRLDCSAMIDCSSTQCRALINTGQDASHYLGKKILMYIQEKGLYGASRKF